MGDRRYLNGMKIAVGSLVVVAGALKATRDLLWTPPVPRKKKNKKYIACVGDSITYGAGVFPKRATKSYPALLQKKIGDEYQVINYGLCGRTLLAAGDVPYTREQYYLDTFRHEMDLYICMLGTNDSKPYNWDEEAYRKELREFIAKYQRKARVVVMTPPKAFKVKDSDAIKFDILNENIIKAREIIFETAAEMDVDVVDLYELTENHPEWFPDGVHSNAEGNLHFAECIYEKIR